MKKSQQQSNVSIHAPARGAIFGRTLRNARQRFQFTHPRGVRFTIRGKTRSRFLFQFTHPRGVRCLLRVLFRERLVSIHAPARGAMRTSTRWCFSQSFNSRTREGCDASFRRYVVRGLVSIHAPARGAIVAVSPNSSVLKFQFTHPRGVRYRHALQIDNCSSFNSRTREGCDHFCMPLFLR